MGPMQVESIASKRYVFVCVDDFSRFTWVDFLKEKSETFDVFKKLCKKLKNEKDVNIGKIIRTRSDHGKEFENGIFAEYCDKHGSENVDLQNLLVAQHILPHSKNNLKMHF